MSEVQGQAPQPKDLKPSIDKAMPYPTDTTHSLIHRNENAFALGRFDKSEKGAQGGEVSVVKDAENLLKVLAVELGLNQDSKELKMLGKFLREKGANEAFQEIAGREIIGKSKEQQVEFMSAGIDSLKKMVSGLMDVREQAKGIRELEVELDELWKDYLNGTEGEKKAIRAFIEQTNLAKKNVFTSLDGLYKAQEDLDAANRFRSRADRYKDPSDKTKYRFGMVGTPVRKFLSWLDRSVTTTAIPRRLLGFLSNSDRADEAYATNLSVELRAKVLASGETGEVLEMWRNGVLSTNELGDLRKKLIVDFAADSQTKQLTPEEKTALEKNTELSKFMQEGNFVKADRTVQAKFFHEFFQKRQDLSLEQYKKAEEAYVGFDFSNANNWDKALAFAGVEADLLMPEFFKKWAVPLAKNINNGVLTFGKDVGKEVGFVIDNMEGMIANSALEDLSSAAVAREMAVESLLKLLNSPEEVDPKEVGKAAEVLRGAESALTRAAMMVARATDTVSITQDKGLALSTILSPVELASAGLDAATGGIMFRKNVGELLKDLRSRTEKLLDGKGALSDSSKLLEEKGDEKKNFVGKVASAEDSRMDDKISKAKIPEQYMDRATMDQHVNRSVFSRTAEVVRKFVGPDTWLAKNSQAWKIMTEGSKRQSVDEVVEATDGNRKMTAVGVELVKEKLLAAEAGVERSMLAVQEATLIAYKQAQEKFTDMGLRQISERSKLDRMWETIFTLEATAAGVAVALAVATGLDAVATTWVHSAEISLGKAAGELSKMRDGAAEIARIARETGLTTANSGSAIDIVVQKSIVSSDKIALSIAEFLQNTAPGAKDILGKILMASPFLAAGRASWNLMPGNRAISSFMKADKIEDVNVV